MVVDKESVARENILRRSDEVSGASVEGYDFDLGVDFDRLMDSYASTGAQATNFSRAVEVVNEMRASGAVIYLGYTSNMVSGGLRDVFRYLVKHKLVDVVVTSAGGVEEDIIKCLGDFKIGSFSDDGRVLREKGINRAGNVLIPNSRYCDFEDFVIPLLEAEYVKQKESGELLTPSKLIHRLGEVVDDERSIYYWAHKNNIPVFCPAITDGSLGDMIYFFKSKNPGFKLDVTDDIVEMNNSTIGADKTGMIILGGGMVKHHICNANMFRNGADFAVYINTAQEFDGSDAGALPQEAISWGKVAMDAMHVKVHADASLVFPLLVAKTFAKDQSARSASRS